MAGNSALTAAGKAKKDEFYTCLEDIESELIHYRDHFKGKVVLCNCDDPYESNFFKYFALNFNLLGLKKLITTCYVGSPVSHTAMRLDNWLDGKPDEKTPKNEVDDNSGRKKIPYKIEITNVGDYNNDGAVDLTDVEYLLRNDANTSTILEGRGDFRSFECIQALKEADIVVTNPPFSLFREYVALLMKYNKKFLIIGNQNALTYKEFFPLIRDNKVWLGYHSGHTLFAVPESYEIPEHIRNSDRARIRGAGYKVDDNGRLWRDLGNICWFTNLDHKKRHEPLRLYAKYDPDKYPKYDNYDAIEVSKVSEIPDDYIESMGVPSEYADRFDLESFCIVRKEVINGREYVFVKEKGCAEMDRKTISLICIGLGIPENELQWCNGAMGVPITFLEKYSLEQFNILGLDRYIEDNPNPGKRFLLRERDVRSRDHPEDRMKLICAGLGIPGAETRWCNGAMGVPITFLDKYSPKQFRIIGATESEGKGFSQGLWNPKSKIAQPVINGCRAYKRIFIKQT